MRVLVVEDDVRLAALLAESLSEGGWQVEILHDGRSAYDRLVGGDRISAVLLDRMLPGMDGLEVTRRLRAAGLATPILMLTARGEAGGRDDGLAAGADDLVAKPFDLDDLLNRLQALCAAS
jgi:two-component system OmpR family response regulator